MNHRVGYNTRITLFTNESISRNIYIYIPTIDRKGARNPGK